MVKNEPVIIAENGFWVAVDKPAGLLSIPDRGGKEPSLKQWLQQIYGSIWTVHRLDKGTSGIILFAKDEDTHKFLSKSFEERTVEKYYVGVVAGILPEKKKIIEAPLMEHPGKKGVMIVHKKGKPSVTEYEVLEEFGRFSLVQFRIHTGRTHQIRVHMQFVGHPIVCDDLYGDPSPIFVSSFKRNFNFPGEDTPERPILQRLGLHATRLKFADVTAQAFNLEAGLHKDMRALLHQLRKNFQKQ